MNKEKLKLIWTYLNKTGFINLEANLMMKSNKAYINILYNQIFQHLEISRLNNLFVKKMFINWINKDDY